MTGWFKQMQSLLPAADSLFGVYWSIDKMITQRQLDTRSLDVITGLDPTSRDAELNRLDELTAYVGSHGLGYYIDTGQDACADYLVGLVSLAAEAGPRAAIRQAKLDVVRLWIPRFLSEDSASILREGRLPDWVSKCETKDLGRRSGAFFTGSGATFRL
jgi:hypothetical protein